MGKRVFISSTFKDLEAYRKTVRDAVRELGAVDVSMEHFGSRDDRPKDECIKLIREQSDVFVGIIAHRYGYIPDGDSMSILEAEYDAATSAQLPRFIYMLKDEVAWPADLKDSGESAQKLSAFKQRLLKRHIVQGFTNKDDVATHVAADLGRYFSEGIVSSDGGHRGILHEPPTDWVSPLNTNHRRYKVVAFDLDGTLLRGDNYQFSWELFWNGLGFSKKIQKDLIREYRSKAQKGADRSRRVLAYHDWCRQACQKFMTRKATRAQLAGMVAPLRLTANCRTALKAMHAEGVVLALISGGVSLLLEEKLSDFREFFDFVFINELLFDSRGYLNDVVSTEYDFEGKAEALAYVCQRVGCTPKDEAVFVGDAFNDEEIMLSVNLAIAYPPKDKVVEEISTPIEEDNLEVVRQLIMQE
jgi:phosphoserine phosphatase